MWCNSFLMAHHCTLLLVLPCIALIKILKVPFLVHVGVLGSPFKWINYRCAHRNRVNLWLWDPSFHLLAVTITFVYMEFGIRWNVFEIWDVKCILPEKTTPLKKTATFKWIKMHRFQYSRHYVMWYCVIVVFALLYRGMCPSTRAHILFATWYWFFLNKDFYTYSHFWFCYTADKMFGGTFPYCLFWGVQPNYFSHMCLSYAKGILFISIVAEGGSVPMKIGLK